MAEKRIKVVWFCAYSDRDLRSHLSFPWWYWGNMVRRMMGMNNHNDFAVWDTNALAEIKSMTDKVELHVIVPHSGIAHTHEFEDDGIFYHVFWHEWDIISEKIKRKFNLRNEKSFKNSRRTISKLIAKIQPDIVHVIGIENKFHSMAVLDIPKDIPVIAQLQTLVSEPRFKESCGATEKEYAYNSEIEKRILQRANYIGTQVSRFREIILRDIKPNAVFVNTSLAVNEPVIEDNVDKEFDFVYFAADISKAADLAIEAFGEAIKVDSTLTLDIVGGYTVDLKKDLDQRIKELGIGSNLTFEGKLPTHDDVIRQIRKSRFALLPLKIDLVSGTIREAMACGIPVVTTITPGTPELNKKRECVLLSEMGDHKAMAHNMIKLISDSEYAARLKSNCLMTAGERISNKAIVEKYVETYYECVYSRN